MTRAQSKVWLTHSVASTFSAASSTPRITNVGLTADVAQRLKAHNAGQNLATATLRPWRLLVSLHFTDEQSAVAFERYLKSGSGRAFAKRHFP